MPLGCRNRVIQETERFQIGSSQVEHDRLQRADGDPEPMDVLRLQSPGKYGQQFVRLPEVAS